MTGLRIDTLETASSHLVGACVTLLFNALAKPERYSAQCLSDELRSDSRSFYRKFFIAVEAGEIIGVGGVKAANWASDTHLLYLSAVLPSHRCQGIGRALVTARVAWVEQNFKSGRILVSSTRAKRYRDLGFVQIPKSSIGGHHLMMRRF